ncbi:Exportin-t, partial [Globisporangium splendens]
MANTISEFEMAVLCAFQYASASLKDQQAQALKLQAESFCNSIKASVDGWRYELELFEFSEHQEVKFYALQALQENVSFVENKAPYLKTKLAVVITLLIKRDYPDRWPTAFSELMSLLPKGASMVEMYFRILVAINEEIVEFDAQRSQAEANANMRIKDAMRESSTMAATFDAIYNVLVNCDASAVMVELSYSALETLKRYISWVDIGLVVNDRIMPLLFKMLRESASLRCPAANCLFEVIDKGMTAEKKVALFQQLNIIEVLGMLPIQDDDEFAEEVGEVINGIGLELVECMDTFRHQNNVELFTLASNMLRQLMPLVWDLFAHETKDVSEEVFEIVNAVGTLIRSESSGANAKAPMNGIEDIFKPSDYIPQIFHGIYRQTRYPEEDDDTDAAEFEEYRRSLYKIYVNITRWRPENTMAFLVNLAQELPPQFGQIDPRDLESFLSLVYRFKEGLAALKTANTYEEPNSPLTDMVVRIHSNMIGAASVPGASPFHPSVLLTYYDLAVRYSRVLQNQNALIPAVLEMMFGPNGLTNVNANVRSRVCYLCLRLVKAIGTSVLPHVSNILQALYPRLVIPDDGEMLARKNDPTFLPYDDQLYLFELTGQVIASLVASSSPDMAEIKYQYAKAVLEPLLQALNASLAELQNGVRLQEYVGERSAALLNAIAHVLKAFRGTNCMLHHQETFTQVLTAATCVLRALPRHPSVRSKVVFTFHRLITVLDGEHLIGNASETLKLLMVCCEASDVIEVVQLLDQLIIKYKEALLPFFEETAMVFVQHLCSLMPPRNASGDNETKDSTQLEREHIQKYLYTLFLHLAMHNLDVVFISERNVGQLENVLRLVLEGCADVTDAAINRGCFTIIHELASRWMLGVPVPVSPDLTPSAEVKAQFTQFVVQEFTSAMFTLTKRHHFDVNDIQCAATMKEIAVFQEVLVKALGTEYIRYLVDVYLPSIGCPADLAASYAEQVATGNRKLIQDAFKAFVSRM